jgi:hypothetical protein
MGKGGLLGFLGLGRKAPQLSLAEFRERIAGEIERRYPDVRVDRIGDDELEIAVSDGAEPRFLNLARNYAAYCEGRRNLAWFIEHHASGVMRDGFDASPEALLVLVRPHEFNPQPRGEDESDRGLIRPLVGFLIVIVAVDAPESYTYAHASDLRRKLRMSDAEIWQRALANTRSQIGYEAAPLEVGQIGEIVTGIGLASSLLAEDEVWDSPEMTAFGPLLVSPIERDRLLFAPINDDVAMDSLRSWHARCQPTSDWLMNDLLVRRDGRWELLTAPA